MAHIKIVKDEVLFSGRYIQTILRHYRGIHGKLGTWEMVHRPRMKTIIGVAAVTSRNELILLKTYRVPQKKYVLEFCLGLKDKKNETNAQTARRELLEETGYRVSKVEHLVTGLTNPGLVHDHIAMFLAYSAKKVRGPQLENSEDITVYKVPLSRVLKFLASPPSGAAVDIKIYIVLFFLAQKGYKIG